MARPTARVLALLELLEGGGIHKLGALAERLGVDERTVRRYLEHLGELGIPVESERGRYGGYRLAAGFRLPPIMLTDDEALEVVLGLAARDTSGSTALAKIVRVLPAASRSKFEALVRTADLGSGGAAPTPTDTAILLAVAEAAGERRPLLVRYSDRDGRRSHRVLLPYGLVARSGRWYLSAADSLSGEVRTFRVDRIVSAEPQDGVFEPPAGVDATELVNASLTAAPWRYEVSVLVEATAQYVRERLPEGLATVIELDVAGSPPGVSIEGWLRIELRAERLHWIPPLLASLDRPFLVEHPAELRDRVRELGERLLEIGSGG